MQKSSNIWKLTYELKRKSQEILENVDLNENRNTVYQNLQNATETVLREKYILNGYIRKEERFYISVISTSTLGNQKEKRKLNLKQEGKT